MVFQGTNFYFSLMRKYVVVFGNFFSNMIITRTLADGSTVADIKVPLQYAQKDKMLVRLNADPDANRPYSALMPVLSFELLSPEYDSERHLTTITRNVKRNANDKNRFLVMYTPVPYNLHFNLYIYVKNEEDGHKILEQILPFFTPDWTVNMELIPEMKEDRDIPVVLNSVNMTDIYDGEFKQRRTLIWTLNFTMKGWFFGPERNKPVIKFATVNDIVAGAGTSNSDGSANTSSSTNYLLQDTLTNDANGNPITPDSQPVATTYTQPGLLANGSPTANLLQSVDWHIIDVNDDWGYATEYTESLHFIQVGPQGNTSWWGPLSATLANTADGTVSTITEGTDTHTYHGSDTGPNPLTVRPNLAHTFNAEIKDTVGSRFFIVHLTDLSDYNVFVGFCPVTNQIVPITPDPNAPPFQTVYNATIVPIENGFSRISFLFTPTFPVNSPLLLTFFLGTSNAGAPEHGVADGELVAYPYIQYDGQGTAQVTIQNVEFRYEL